MDVVKINTNLVLSEAFWVWLPFVSSEMLRIRTFGYRHPLKVFFKVSYHKGSYFMEHHLMAPSDKILGDNLLIFKKNWPPYQKPAYAPIHSLFEIPSNENSETFTVHSL